MADEPKTEPAEPIVEPVIETNPEPQTPEPKEEPQEELEELKETPEAEEDEQEPKPPSRREQLRVSDLLKKYGSPSEQPSQSSRQGALNYREALSTEDESLYDTLEADRKAEGQAQFNQGLERANYYKWETLLSVDEPLVRTKYPELDPSNKEKYHPALANAMANKFALFAGYDPGDSEKGIARSVRNPDIRYSDFVEAEMEFADELASQRVATTTKNIAQQAATTGLRPDGSSAKRLNLNKQPEDMTIEELYASIGQTPPPQTK